MDLDAGHAYQPCRQRRHYRHRHAEFLAFLKLVAKAYPRRQLHVALDSYGTHTHPTAKAWLAKHPRVHRHFTPTSARWMSLVEMFVSIITRQAIRRGSFASVGDLVAAIRRFVDGWTSAASPLCGSRRRRHHEQRNP